MSDSIIYEARPIPPEGPQEGKRWSAIIGGIALIAILILGVAFGAALFRGDDEPDPLADPDPSQPTVTLPQTATTVVRSPFTNRASRDGAAEFSRPGRGGGGDVGTPTPALPAQEFSWEKITLDLPAGADAYLQGVYAVNDGFIAIGSSWSETGGQDMFVWTSADGTEWVKGELNGDFTNASVYNFMFNEYGGIALGEEFTETFYSGESDGFYPGYETPARIVWTTPDGLNWTRSEIDFATGDNQSLWLSTALAGPDGYLVIGQLQTSPEFTPMVIDKDGYQLTISDYSYSYQLIDASGMVVAEGSMEAIYGNEYTEEGQAVINPDTGELIVVVPYEEWELAWEKAYNESSGGPFGGYGGDDPPTVVIEYGGYRITVDEEAGTYLIEDSGSGGLLFSGSADYLWRGPAPVISDKAGNEILSFTWEEFDTAQQAFWEGQERDYEYQAELIVAKSTDGVTWTTSSIDSGSRETSFDSIVVRNGRYLAFGNQYDESGGGPTIWSSPDGLTWKREADMPGGMYIWNVRKAPDGTLLAMGDGPQGTSLWSSTDGIAWGEAFGARVPADRSLYEYFNQFATGELGTVVVGSRESNYYDEYGSDPMTFTQDEYTLTYNDYDWPPRVTIMDNITGDVVIDEVLSEEGGLPEGFFYEDGVTIIENNDNVLMVITDEEWYEAQDARWANIEGDYVYQPADTTVYFSTDLETWTEVPTALEGWINTVAVGSNAVVLAGQEGGSEHPLEADSVDLPYVQPAPVLWVGRP